MDNLNYNNLNEIINLYKENFEEYRRNELYKWKAIKTFQDNWNIEAEDFTAMLKASLKDSANLLNSAMYFPKAMIIKFSEYEKETTRKMFKILFDETIELVERYKEFISMANEILIKYWKNGKKHYQDAHAVSVYLTFRYPDKYYVYKSLIDNQVAKFLEVKIYDQDKSKELMNFFSLADKVLQHIKKNKELVKLHRNNLTEDCYHDDKLHILTWDLLFVSGRVMRNAKTTRRNIRNIIFNKEKRFIDFYKWLKDNTKLKESTIVHYCSALESVENEFFINFKDIEDVNELKKIWSYLYSDIKFAQKNAKGNRMYSAALNQYEKYIISKGKNKIENNIIQEQRDKYSKEKFLTEVFISEKDYNKIVRLIKRKKNVILQGPPGVGKTFMAKRIAYSIMEEQDDERIQCIQFHQSYSYEDFIEGWRPTKNSYKLEEGIFYSFCKKAKKDENRDYFFIIDEINRGNLSKIFGELLMLIENDKREESLNLAYSQKPFSVPNNVYMIGMMNTADRSLAIIDYALRRRFAFYNVNPSFDNESFKKYQKELNSKKLDQLIKLIEQLNIEIEQDPTLGAGFKIGHSYFCNLKDITKEDIESIILYEILPLIEEYWFDDIDKYNVWVKKLNEVIDG